MAIGINSKPNISNLPKSRSYGKVIGRQSADGLRGWRIDFDPIKGPHINIFDYSKGKGSNAIKKPFHSMELKLTLKDLLNNLIGDFYVNNV